MPWQPADKEAFSTAATDEDAPRTYREAGVDVERADRFVEHIRSLSSAAVARDVGAFAGALPLPAGEWKEPVLLTTADGVGTKLLLARETGRYDTIGIDLVAMNVNDLMARGCMPLCFQDYIACGRVDEAVLHPLMEGIVRGCELAECLLAGGETAELPDMYGPGDVDLAGFAAGVAERSRLLPRLGQITKGDLLLGLPSSGIHSNGLTLARKVLSSPEDRRALLEPTRIYRREMETLLATGRILAAAHITGGGLEANIRRALPAGLKPELNGNWPVPPVFDRIEARGVPHREMLQVFNMGLGMVVVVRQRDRDVVMRSIDSIGGTLLEVGCVSPG